MAGQITWRNVSGPSLADASRPLSAAQSTFNSAFNVLNRALGQRQEAASYARDKTIGDNTQTYLDQLAQYRTPEEMQAAQSSGAIASLLAGFGDQIDRGAVRGAADARLATLRDQTTKGNLFEDSQTERQWRPTAERLRTLASSGDADQIRAAREALSIYAGQGLPNAGQLGGDILRSDRENTKFGWDASAEGRKAEMHPLELDRTRAATASSRASTAESGLRQQLTRGQILTQEEELQAQDALGKAYMQARGNTVLNGLPVPDAMASAAEGYVQSLSPRAQARVLQEAAKSDQASVGAWRAQQDAEGFVGSSPLNPTAVINEMDAILKTIPGINHAEVADELGSLIRDGYTTSDGTRIPIPANVVRAAIQTSDTNLFGFDRGTDAVDKVKAMMKRKDVQADIITRWDAEKLRDELRKEPVSPNSGVKKK